MYSRLVLAGLLELELVLHGITQITVKRLILVFRCRVHILGYSVKKQKRIIGFNNYEQTT